MKNIQLVFITFVMLLPIQLLGQSRLTTSEKEDIILSGKVKKYRIIPHTKPTSQDTRQSKEVSGEEEIASTKSFKRRGLPPSYEKWLKEQEEKRLKEVPVVPSMEIATTKQPINETIPQTVEVENVTKGETWKAQFILEGHREEIADLAEQKAKLLANGATKAPKQDVRVLQIIEEYLDKGGPFPKMLIDEGERYAMTFANKDLKDCNVPERKIHDVIQAYHFNNSDYLAEDRKFKGSWWKAKPYRSPKYNPDLVAKIELPPEENGEYGQFPLKTKRNPAISSGFGHRNKSGAWYSEITGTLEIGGDEDLDGHKRKEHQGVDIPFDASNRTPNIHAWRSGVVVYSGFNAGWNSRLRAWRGYGHVVIVEHGMTEEGLPLTSVYAHLSKRNVSVGDWVSMGDIVGLGGSSATGAPHLHFEICLGDMPLDPEAFFNLRRPGDKKFREIHTDRDLFEMAGGNYIVYPQGHCKDGVCARDWTYTTAAVEDAPYIGEQNSPQTKGYVMRTDPRFKNFSNP